MLYKIKLLTTNKEYDIFPQFKIIDKFNTELDVFEFTLKPIEEELDLDFDKYNGFIPIVLMGNNVDYRIMYLTYYRQVTVAYSPVKLYKYLFQATSLTFALQRITLPNKLITQPINENKRTIWVELNKILEVYAPDIMLDPELETLLNVPSPELQFTKSTLHEILIVLFAIVGLAPKMDYLYYLSYIDLKSSRSSRKLKMSDVSIRLEKTNSIGNYADALDYDLQNILGIDDTITTTWLVPTSEEAMVTDDNFIWQLPNDIYEITKIEAKVNGSIAVPTTSGNEITEFEGEEIDFTNYVAPKEIWETLKISALTSNLKGKYKRNYVYYEENKINGNFLETTWLGSVVPIDRSIKNALKYAMEGSLHSLPNMQNASVTITSSYRNIKLKVTYKPLKSSTRVKIIKDKVVKSINNLISNQDDSYVDANHFGAQKKELINRMGNEIITAQANYNIDDVLDLKELQIANLGDFIDNDYIVAEREMQFNENTLMVNYHLAKEYVFLTGYSGLNQLKRFTSIDTKGVLVRNDNFIHTIQMTMNETPTDDLITYVVKDYGKGSTNPKDLHLVRTFDNNGDLIFEETNEYALLTSQNSVIADSVLCQLGFETNAKVGDSIEESDKAYLKQPLKYVDNNGEFKEIQILFGAGEKYRDIDDLATIRKYPRVNETTIESEHFEETHIINKDNRELTNVAIQFRFVGDNDNIIVYNDFAKYTRLTSHLSADFLVYRQFFEAEEEFNAGKYKLTTSEIIGQLSDDNVTIEQLSENHFKIWNVARREGYWAIGVFDKKGNILFAINYLNTGNYSIDLYFKEI